MHGLSCKASEIACCNLHIGLLLICKLQFTICNSQRRKRAMATLYVASTETFVGKSAACIGLLDRARQDGFRISYMKPVSVSAMHTEDAVLDEDAAFIRQHFSLAESLDRIAPVLVTQGVVER